MADRLGAPVHRFPARALAVFAGVLAVTAAWWALALWPLPSDSPAWLTRTRAVCFGTGVSGAPDAAGWIALIVQPAVMFGIATAVWGAELRDVGRWIGRSRVASGAALAAALALVIGATALALSARDRVEPARALAGDVIEATGPAPELAGLIDQSGRPLSLDRFHGQELFVTFAFGHCETVCPLVVAGALEARRRLEATGRKAPALVVVTLDPWRDTPSRLPFLAERWKLDENAFAAGGDVPSVEHVLDAWGVSRSRNTRTGDVVHPPVVHLVSETGMRLGTGSGEPGALVALTRAPGTEP